MQKDTSLPVACIRASLMQETVRRLLNCSKNIKSDVRTQVLNNYATKLINSGHSPQSSRILIVQGVTKYLHKLKLSNLSVDDPEFKPLYFDKKYQEEDRQFDKFQAKKDWYRSKKKKNGTKTTRMMRRKRTRERKGSKSS